MVNFHDLLFCQPRVEVTSCFVYKVMALTFYDRINTLLINILELAQVVARRITKPQRNCLGSNLTGCSFLFSFFLFLFFGGGGWGGGLILSFSSCFFFFLFNLSLFFLVFIPLTCIRHIYKNICNNINYCQYVNNI